MEILDLYNLRIKQVIDIFGLSMLKNPNIIGVGRGNKVINNHRTNNPALVFYVEKKLGMNSLNNSDKIPPYVHGVLTDVIESGPLISKSTNSNTYQQTNVTRPALGGGGLVYQLPQLGTYSNAATLTYAFTQKNDKTGIYFLTSKHFTMNIKDKSQVPIKYVTNLSEVNHSWELGRILYESTWSTSKEGSTRIFLIDAALGFVGPNNATIIKNKLSPGLLNGNVITGVQSAKIGDKVYKYGLSSGLTTGIVTTLNCLTRSTVILDDISFLKDQIITDQKAIPGDSGALGVIESTGKAFGMLNGLFGNFPCYSNIQTVMDNFDIEFLI